MTINVELKTGVFWYKDLEKRVLELTKSGVEMEDRVIWSFASHYSIAKEFWNWIRKPAAGITLRRCYLRYRELHAKKIGTGALHPATFHVQMADFLQQYVKALSCGACGRSVDKAEIERSRRPVLTVITNYPDVAVPAATRSDTIGEKSCSFLDIDGTICVGNRLIPEQTGFLNGLSEYGGDYVFIHQNMTMSVADYRKKFAKLGISDNKRELSDSIRCDSSLPETEIWIPSRLCAGNGL